MWEHNDTRGSTRTSCRLAHSRHQAPRLNQRLERLQLGVEVLGLQRERRPPVQPIHIPQLPERPDGGVGEAPLLRARFDAERRAVQLEQGGGTDGYAAPALGAKAESERLAGDAGLCAHM